MAKYSQYAEILETRIQRGDYSLRELPTEQEFAAEVGTSRMTARRALLELIDRGVVVRKPYGRLTVPSPADRASQLSLALLAPAFPSMQFLKWSRSAEHAVYDRGGSVQVVQYAHWDDPVIARALSTFDGVFLIATSELIPARIRNLLAASANLIALDHDMSDLGVPSIRMMRPSFVHQLGDHLYRLGHRRIDCINSQPGGGVIDLLAEQWTLWKSLHGVEGEIYNDPVAPNTHPVPGAYRTACHLLDDGGLNGTAVLCLTSAVMTGVIRAYHEHGMAAGRDISICCIDSGDNTAAYETPSRTCIVTPSPDNYMRMCVKWFADGGGKWKGPMLLQPPSAELFAGESTTKVEVDNKAEVSTPAR